MEETKMQREVFHPVVIVSCIALLCLAMVLAAESAKAEETEVLEIVVSEPTKLDDLVNQNTASISGSRSGVVAAFYPWAQRYRTATDGGLTWGPAMDSPAQLGGGSTSGTLRDGGVIKYLTEDYETVGDVEAHSRPMVGEYKDGWFMLHSTFAWFNDDFTKHEVAPVHVYMPDAVTTKQTHLSMSSWPVFERGNMIQLDNGDLLAPLYGLFKEDTKTRPKAPHAGQSRVILCRSSDRGHTWRYHATVATGARDPNPELPGQYNGPCEPSLEMLPNGQLICVFRTQSSHYPGEYRPISVCWSNALGRTWTKPLPTQPHLMNIAPKLIVLENGVVALEYGRPGFHVAFSTDNGHTWKDRVSFSHLPCGIITGQFDMAKAGPNKLVAIGNDGGGTKVWPLAVGRVKVSTTHERLHGRVLDEQGHPIANTTIERSPNRYTADDWLEHETKLDHWGAGTPVTVGSPSLGFKSIRRGNGHPTVKSDAEGRFDFHDVALGEYVLTVEADGYAPQHRHVNVRPQSQSQDFKLKPGRLVRSKVIDETGRGIPGTCVVLNRWHVHTDSDGYFHWSLEGPVPQQVTLKVYKRYSNQYETTGELETTVALSQLESQPITLKNR